MSATTAQQAELRQIPLSEIALHPSNPRRDVGDIGQLADSIKRQGVLQPIVVVGHNGGYLAVAGGRRLAAAKAAGLKHIPALVRTLTDAEAGTVALIENLEREDLDPLEEAQAYQDVLKLTGWTQAKLAEALGRSQGTIANALRLLGAPEPVRQALREGAITASHAEVALELKDPGAVTKLPLKPGVRVDDLKARVQDLNAAHATTGAGAAEAARKALANAQRAHPNATITWREPRNWSEKKVVDLVKALGKPPKADIAGEIRTEKPTGTWDAQRPTAAAHDKLCDCQAYLLAARESYAAGRRAVFELQRVCIERSKYRKLKPKGKAVASRRSGGTKAKPVTEAQKARKEAATRKRAEGGVAKELSRLSKPTERPHYAPIWTRLRKGQIPADVARAIAYLGLAGLIEGRLYRSAEQHVAWERIKSMPAKKLSGLAANALSDAFAYHLDMQARDTRGDAGPEKAIAEYFGVKPAEPKAKKAAKR